MENKEEEKKDEGQEVVFGDKKILLRGDDLKEYQEMVAKLEKSAASPSGKSETLRDGQDFGELIGAYVSREFERLNKNTETKKLVPQATDSEAVKQEKFHNICRAMVNPIYAIQNPAIANDLQRAYQESLTRATQAANEGTTTQGLYAVPPEVVTDIVSMINVYGNVQKDFKRIPMVSNVHKITPLTSTISVTETAELIDATHSNALIDQKSITAGAFTGLTSFSKQVLADTTPNFYGTIIQAFGQAFAKNIERTAVYGKNIDGTTSTAITAHIFAAATGSVGASGTAITNSGGATIGTDSTSGKTVITLGTTVPNISGIGVEVLNAAIGALPAVSLSNAKWYMHRSLYWNVIRNVKDGANRPLYVSWTDGAGAGMAQSLLGYPVEFAEVMDDVSTVDTGTGFAFFGNLSNSCYFGDRNQTDFMISEHATVNAVNMFTAGGLGVRFAMRYGFLTYVPRFLADGNTGALVTLYTK